MRDNILLADGFYDDMEFCGDLTGFFHCSTGRTAMIVWGDPWDPKGWEVTEAFVNNWGWTLRGCSKLLESTNKWRKRRDEEQLLYAEPVFENIIV